MAPASPCLPSLLLATSTTGLLARRAKSANDRSFGVRPARASITNISASARPIAASVCSCIRAVSEPLAPSSRPAVSMMVNSRSPSRACPSRRSRVTPGSSSTSASFCPTSRLNSVDLPTLGRPMMATVKDISDPCARYEARVNARLFKSALECAAGHRRRKRRGGLLRLGRGRCGLRRGGIGRWRRGSTPHDLLRLRSRRRGGGRTFFLRCCLTVGRSSRRRRGARGLPGFALRFRVFLLRLFDGLGNGDSRGVLLLRRALVKILRYALLETRHTLRKHRLALARQLLLCIEPV